MIRASESILAPSIARGLRPAPELRRLAMFVAVGLLGLSVDASAFSGLSAAGLPSAAARIASIACATGATWWMNRSFTFATRRSADAGEVLRYASVTLASQSFSFGLFLALSALAALPPLAALLTGAAAATALSFTGHRLLSFRPA